MYSFIEGKIASVNPAMAVISCSGIGYNIHISLNTFSKIKDAEACKLFTHLIVREDALQLYGFADPIERNVFQQLISVSGIGPNTARLILSSLTASEVADAIATENVKLLQSIKGIGGKTAQRAILDLKDKVLKIYDLDEVSAISNNTNRDEALSALEVLGFVRKASEKVVEKVLKEHPDASVELIIKQALKNL